MAKNDLMGVTKTGFKFKLEQSKLDNYELMEVIDEIETNPVALVRLVKLLLGKEQADKLKDHVRNDEGIVTMTDLQNEIMDIFQSQASLKKS